MDANIIDKCTNEITKGIKQLLPQTLSCIYLYGSCARGDYQEFSDIDVMVVVDCDAQEISYVKKEIAKLASRIGLDNDTLLSCQVRSKDEWQKRNGYLPYYQNILREGKVLYG